MDLYTLNENFLPVDIVDEFVSAIWTERYFAAGDFKLVVPASQDNIDRLAPGVFLAIRGSDEVMQVLSQDIDKGALTVVGNTLTAFLNERFAWFKNPSYNSSDADSPMITDYTQLATTAGEFICSVVDQMVINTASYTTPYNSANLNWPLEEIAHLTLGNVDSSGAEGRFTIPIGPIYDGIAKIAQDDGVGFRLFLEYADPDIGYSLKFESYRGTDHTVDSANPVVRLVPEMDTITDLKEVHSIAAYKNICYVWYQKTLTKHLAEPSLPEPEGFDRRILITEAEGEPVGRKVNQPFMRFAVFGPDDKPPGGSYTGYTVGPAEITAFREQNARDALANHNYIRAIGGQTSPKNDYKYGVDYGMGDIIELQGITGIITKARVTEYIRSEDENGEREYPTISVV